MKKILLSLFVMLPSLASAQQSPSKIETPLISTQGSFFALSVSDMNESVKWYCEKLGLKVITQAPTQNKVAFTTLGGGGLIVELIRHEDSLPLSMAAPQVKEKFLVHGIFKVGIIVDDLDKILAILKSRDVNIYLGPFPVEKEQKANFIIKDNAGNFIQFFQK